MLKVWLKLPKINPAVLQLIILGLCLISGLLSPRVYGSILGNIELPSEVGFLKNTSGKAGLTLLASNIIRLIFLVAGTAIVFFFLFGGVKWIFSGGDKQQVESAKNMMTAAIIGFAIVALTYVAMRVIEAFFGITIVGSPTGAAPPPPACPPPGCPIGPVPNCGVCGAFGCQACGGQFYCCP